MDKIFDYIGNEVKEGMSIYFVQTNIHQMEMGFLMPGGGYQKVIDASDTDCWILGKEYLVKDGSMGLYVEIKAGSYTFMQTIESAFIFNKQTIAIKGVSDKEPVKIKTQ